MAGIAISYRRDDTGWITGRIFDRLKGHYENPARSRPRAGPLVFMDYDSTPVGADFRRHIQGVLDNCDIVLAIIGPRWAENDEHGQPRLFKETDWVRIEIETALKKGIPVVPVLIDRTPMPQPETLPEAIRDLVYRQAAVVDTQVDFNSHIERLIREIDRTLGIKTPIVSVGEGARSSWLQSLPRNYLLGAISLCALTAILWIAFSLGGRSTELTYTNYSSPDLGVTVIWPNNVFTLDDTLRKERTLLFRDGDGQALIKVIRSALPDERDPKVGRANEIANLTKMNFVLTYIAPERETNWSNWYVLSGVNHGTEFYFRRWYAEDSVASIEFMYPKALAPLFDKVIPKMTQEFVFTSIAPRN